MPPLKPVTSNPSANTSDDSGGTRRSAQEQLRREKARLRMARRRQELKSLPEEEQEDTKVRARAARARYRETHRQEIRDSAVQRRIRQFTAKHGDAAHAERIAKRKARKEHEAISRRRAVGAKRWKGFERKWSVGSDKNFTCRELETFPTVIDDTFILPVWEVKHDTSLLVVAAERRGGYRGTAEGAGPILLEPETDTNIAVTMSAQVPGKKARGTESIGIELVGRQGCGTRFPESHPSSRIATPDANGISANMGVYTGRSRRAVRRAVATGTTATARTPSLVGSRGSREFTAVN
ncbi:hypothetical protein B0H11DRAFT_1920497 [Mycena galericulata]|nr:hypothetical protein B0H11DRAFT_1920497 [Mycena galericulata]